MRRKEVIKRIDEAAKEQGRELKLLRHGARHDVYLLGSSRIPIPRHKEFSNQFAEVVWRECSDVLGEGWWR
jgi:hypothetical protein